MKNEKVLYLRKISHMKILSVKQFSNKLKVSIQSSGRLSFTDDTARTLEIKDGTPIKFAIDEDKGRSLYLVVAANMEDEDAFKVRKSGSYFYVPTKNLFDALEVDYSNKSVGYDLIRAELHDSELGGMAFRMSERENKNRSGGDDEVNDI